jgi:hypothetical protein
MFVTSYPFMSGGQLLSGSRRQTYCGLILGPVALAMFFTVIEAYYRDYHGIETRAMSADSESSAY